MHIRLTQLPHGTLYLAGFATYPELKAAKLRAQHKRIGVGYAGKAADVKEWQAARWVRFRVMYRDYRREEEYTGGFSRALESFRTALEIIGNPAWVIIYQR